MNQQPAEPPEMSATTTARDPLPADEIANGITHGLGFFLSLGVMVFFWITAADRSLGLRVSCVIFTLSMAAVYLFSTLSHVVREPHRRNRMRAWDQGTIYTLIAGTYTPFIWQASPPGWTGAILVGVWAAAAAGFYMKVLAAYRVNAVSTVTYVLLGWLPALPLYARTPTLCFLWMLMGGLSYTLGIFFLIGSHKTWYTHSIWHVMVMLGSACHCIAVNFLLGYAAA